MIIWHVETSAGARFEWARDEEHLRQQLIEYNNDTLNSGCPEDQLAEDTMLDDAIEKIEEQENFSREDAWGVHSFTPLERDTILAALRFWKRCGHDADFEEWMLSKGNQEDGQPMTDTDLDQLIERIKP